MGMCHSFNPCSIHPSGACSLLSHTHTLCTHAQTFTLPLFITSFNSSGTNHCMQTHGVRYLAPALFLLHQNVFLLILHVSSGVTLSASSSPQKKLESLVRRGIVHTDSPCGKFVGYEAAERGFGHLCRGRTYRIGSERRISVHTLFLCFPARGICCAMGLVFSLSRVSDAYRDQVCTQHVVRPLPSGWVVLAACAEQFCSRAWLDPASALVVSTATGCLPMVRKYDPHVLGAHTWFHWPSTAGLLCVQVSTCPCSHLPGT